MRKTTVSLPEKMLETLRIRAIRRGTTMSALIQEAVEAYHFGGRRGSEGASLAPFFRPSPEEARDWLVGTAAESEDFEGEDVD